MAAQCPQSTRLHVLPYVRLEVVQIGGDIALVGEGELLLTNMLNRRTLFIRYRTGDVEVIAGPPCCCGYKGQQLVELVGREKKQLRFGSRRVDTLLIERAMASVGVSQYKVSSEGGRLKCDCVADTREQEGSLNSRIEEILLKALGPGPLSVRIVDSPPRTGSKMLRFTGD